MRQLNNKHFDTIEGASARQGEVVSSASSPLVSQQKDEKMTYKQAKKERKTVDYVFYTATNDKGMTAKDTALFHLHNPNGNYTLCKEWGREAYLKGYFTHGLFAGKYEYERLNKLSELKKPRWIPVKVLVEMLEEDALLWPFDQPL